jgi:hypothetical protein
MAYALALRLVRGETPDWLRRQKETPKRAIELSKRLMTGEDVLLPCMIEAMAMRIESRPLALARLCSLMPEN